MPSSTLTIRLDPALKKRLYAAAKRDDRTATSFLVHALRRALEETSYSNTIEVVDIGKDGTGPWRLMVNGYGVATWPPAKDASWKWEAYAEEVARVLRKAIR